MSNGNTVTLPREAVEQALEAMESGVTGTDHDRKAKALRAALEQPNHILDAGNMTPEGWKLVPVEPTKSMVESGLYMMNNSASFLKREMAVEIFQAMLDAAPPTTEDSLVVQQQAMAWVWFDKNRKPCNVTFGGPNINTPKDWVVLPLYTHQQPPTTEQSSAVQPQPDPTPYLWYDPENGDTWTQDAIDEGFCATDGLIPLYTK